LERRNEEVQEVIHYGGKQPKYISGFII